MLNSRDPVRALKLFTRVFTGHANLLLDGGSSYFVVCTCPSDVRHRGELACIHPQEKGVAHELQLNALHLFLALLRRIPLAACLLTLLRELLQQHGRRQPRQQQQQQ